MADMSKREPVSHTIVKKIADREGVDPAEMNPPLHSVIDTDALDALFQPTSTTARKEGTIEFYYCGYQVQVDRSGEVQIGETISFTEPTEPPAQSTEDTIEE